MPLAPGFAAPARESILLPTGDAAARAAEEEELLKRSEEEIRLYQTENEESSEFNRARNFLNSDLDSASETITDEPPGTEDITRVRQDIGRYDAVRTSRDILRDPVSENLLRGDEVIEIPDDTGKDIRDIRSLGDFQNARSDTVKFRHQVSPMRRGGFLIYPKLTFSQGFNDNVLASNDVVESDIVSTVEPEVRILKRYGRHAFYGRATGRINRYWQGNEEDTKDIDVTAGGVLEARRALLLPFAFSFETVHRDRIKERNNVLPVERFAYRVYTAQGGVQYQPNRLLLEGTVQARATRFDDGRDQRTDALLVRRDNDLNRLSFKGLAAYAINANLRPFVDGYVVEERYERRAFNGTDFAGVLRDNRLIGVGGGIFFNYRGIITGQARLGTERRTYTASTLDTANNLVADLDITWQPREHIVAGAYVSRRSIDDTEVSDVVIETTGGFDLNYEIIRNLYLGASARLTDEEFTRRDRNDTLLETGVSLNYQVHPRISTGVEFNHNRRSSDNNGFEFDQNVLMFRVTGAY